ncbi:SDR family NAD(P)-dependent oxidoreductase [Terrilactibacillus sp. BCM23-1]|uniref:SDR family NAD(P)-dependent oxidoreductase n=1 Tax=Terrilactibacillus tamarindi TaxID=2599694 RepID=A0A6N8CRS7_9BACI|nr:SDR family NAD(P)-dependent oxidoreductase [Terrilactibacillus tamarindi]MTT32874.1 SDR family NAD(P)-dependent oxidoreductase [Terrilactibacillus tamarindi]
MNKGTALITGASGGIGLETARKLAAEGWSLYLHYYQGSTPIQSLSDELAIMYPKQFFSTIQADLSVKTGPKELIEQLMDPIDCVVYNCGKSHVALMTEVDHETLDAFIQLNLTSPFVILQELLPHMIHQKKGKIIFVSSIWGITGASMEVMYSMVKGGQNTLIKALAKEVAPSQISVNGVAPGAVDTQMMKDFSAEDLAFIKEDIPMGRLANPAEIADLIGYLVSPSANYINGQIISINGAWYC